MNKTYYFRKSKLGFLDWIKALPECRLITREFGVYSTDLKIEKFPEYDSAIRVKRQYDVLMMSLNPKQKEYWNKRYVKGVTPSWNDKESFYLEEVIYQNWLEIITKTQKILDFPSMKEIGNKLKEYRIKSGYSMRQIAEILEVDERTIQRYEHGYYYPRLDLLYQMLKIYDVDYEKLIK